MNRLPRRGKIHKKNSQHWRLDDRKRAMSVRPLIEGLEDRTVLSTITWNTAVAPTGGDWDMSGDWVGGVVPNSSNDVVINLTGSGTVTHSTAASDAALSLTTNSNTALSLGSGSLTLGNGSTTLGGSVIVGIGAALNVSAGAKGLRRNNLYKLTLAAMS